MARKALEEYLMSSAVEKSATTIGALRGPKSCSIISLAWGECKPRAISQWQPDRVYTYYHSSWQSSFG